MTATAANSAAITVRVDKVRADAARAARTVDRIAGRTRDAALAIVRFRPEMQSAEIAAVLDRVVAEVRKRGRRPEHFIINEIDVVEGEPITRLRRMAHGVADWITTPP